MTLADRQADGGLASRLVAWLTSLGPLAVDRPPPSLGHAAAGVGGALVAAALVVIGIERWASTGESAQGIVLTLVLLGGSVVAMARMPPPLSVAGVAASGVAAVAAAFFLAASGGGFPSLREMAVLAGVLVACLYAVGPWRGHTFHLALLVVAGWLVALTAGDVGFSQTGGFRTVADAITSAGAASMALGVVYLAVGSWLHDEGVRGVATPFLAVAALALPIGAFALLRDSNSTLQGAILVVAGAAIAFVGGRCRRRGLTWIGVGVIAFGVGLIPEGLTDSTVVGAVLVGALGAALVAAAPRAAALVGEDAGQPDVIPPPPPDPPANDELWAPPYFVDDDPPEEPEQ